MADILVLGKYYPPYSGGIEVNTRDVSEGLAAEHTVTVICFNHDKGSRTDIINNVTVKRFGILATLKSQPVSFALFLAILRAKADIIHFHAPNFVANAALWVKICVLGASPKLVVTHHTDIFGRKLLKKVLMPLYRSILKRSNCIIVTSRKLIDISEDLIPNANYAVVPLGITPEVFHGGMAPDTASTLSKPVGFLGRHARYKGLGVLINALRNMPDVSAKIAGDGPYRPEAELLATSLGVRERTDFVGDIRNIDAKIAFYKSIGIFAFPSTEVTETFGISQLEAMLMGVPVVASNLHTGVTDVAVHEETALLVTPGSSEEFSAAVTRLRQDPDLRERLAINARAHVLKNFTNSVVVAKTLALFSSVLAAKGSNEE